MNEPLTRPIAAKVPTTLPALIAPSDSPMVTRQVRKAMIAAAAQVAVESQGLWRKLVLSA